MRQYRITGMSQEMTLIGIMPDLALFLARTIYTDKINPPKIVIQRP